MKTLLAKREAFKGTDMHIIQGLNRKGSTIELRFVSCDDVQFLQQNIPSLNN